VPLAVSMKGSSFAPRVAEHDPPTSLPLSENIRIRERDPQTAIINVRASPSVNISSTFPAAPPPNSSDALSGLFFSWLRAPVITASEISCDPLDKRIDFPSPNPIFSDRISLKLALAEVLLSFTFPPS